MKSIETRTYTNVVLTVLALLLLVLVAQPYVSLPAAHAQLDLSRNEQQSDKLNSVEPLADQAAATREVAAANLKIAEAITKAAAAQSEIAAALARLSVD
ncbi:MAG TPA: hypothetical protein PK847_11070 [Candidatus Sumerlaeota bacterium]|nr:hypothetical protein [Candidatus Sumerlaeota bacterium]HOR28438.1 hypothetical protein [Candidatus Sumerlaeota bacterium]